MGRHLKRLTALALAAAMLWLGGLLADSRRLRREILRLHVVAASDSEGDQQLKLRVRDAVLGSLEEGLEDLQDPQAVYAYVEQVLPKLERAANHVLREAGVCDTAQAVLTREAFPVRAYDSFSLPSGVYHSLRIVIGEGRGHNWWCVVFPALCTGQDPEAFREAAQDAGLPQPLTGAMEGRYEIRFWLLDQIGRLENFLQSH